MFKSFHERLHFLDENTQFKARIGFTISLVGAIFAWISLAATLSFSHLEPLILFLSASLRIFALGSCYMQWRNPELDRWRTATLFAFVLMIFVGICDKRGINNAPATMALVLMPIMATQITSVRHSSLVTALVLVAILGGFSIEAVDLLPPKKHLGQEINPTHRMMQYLCYAFASFFVGLYAIRGRKEHQKLREELAHQEKARQLIITYNHEINNPLGSLKGSLDLLTCKGQYDQSLVDKAQRSTDRIAQVVKDLDRIAKGSADLVETEYSHRTSMVKLPK
ncbi:histidine kinase dimerization/phospho-acceptor domain-containing protein [Pseudobacteriovorax antillogorgiicola]|uniref:histidine kinase n=1 Tax=Pseudobacteriovorax antillogorgiicola TaxID=1513793 RepID=A0A1Y6BEQ4_9BACT|nr:histidine kinase dimerization/phospho-acceptor domain-containing protein [Pseudobacteriovorax antillogorgiicola]TCS57506.1 phospho-acceptor domain-containing protein [Pseudobacteriovorax antillogorgiicola]SMF00290.1 His Kinase A (phospho-acceptor) domain-containing protein [Pseudobacteriovorax antillogorgiicola]